MGRTRPDPIVAVSSYRDLGGGEILLVDLLTSLARRGFAAELLALGDGAVADRARDRGIPVTVGPAVRFSRPHTVASGVLVLARTLRQVRPALVHSANPKAQLLQALARGARSVEPVASVQLLDPPPSGDPYVRATRHLRALRFAITPASQTAWSAALPGRAVELVEPGIDGAALRTRAERGDAARAWKKAGIDRPGAARVLMVSRLQRYKGTFDFVDLAAHLLPEIDASFLVVGPDEAMEPGEREAVRRRIRDRGLAGRAGVAGPLSDDDLAAVMRDATVLVHPAHTETFGLVIVEAMAVGTPVIAYGAPGPAHILRHGGGTVVACRDVEALAAATRHAVSDPGLRARWAREAKAVAAHFAAERMTDGYAAAFARAAPTTSPDR